MIMVENKNNEKNKRNLVLYIIVLVIAILGAYLVGYIVSKNTLEKKDSTTNSSNVEIKSNSNSQSNNQENVDEPTNSNVAQNNVKSKTYTINDIVGTFEAGNSKLFLSNKGMFSQEYNPGCADYKGNYLLDENTITLYPIIFFTCELSTTEIVKDKEIKVEIISKDELSVNGTTYKRIDFKNFDDSTGGLRYLFKTAIESLPSE